MTMKCAGRIDISTQYNLLHVLYRKEAMRTLPISGFRSSFFRIQANLCMPPLSGSGDNFLSNSYIEIKKKPRDPTKA
jgi:hypothetical protein